MWCDPGLTPNRTAPRKDMDLQQESVSDLWTGFISVYPPLPHHHRWGAAAAATPSSNFKQSDFYLEITSGCSFSPSSSVLIQNNGYGSTEALAKTQCSATQPLFTGHDVVVLQRCPCFWRHESSPVSRRARTSRTTKTLPAFDSFLHNSGRPES